MSIHQKGHRARGLRSESFAPTSVARGQMVVLVHELYGLTPEEIKVVEGATDENG